MLQEVEPYRSVDQALRALDNGGSFLDVFAKAGDGVVDGSELAKAAAVARPRILQALFLATALSGLVSKDRDAVEARLESALRREFAAVRPKPLRPSDFETLAEPAAGHVVAGVSPIRKGGNGLGTFVQSGVSATTGVRWTRTVPVLPEYDVVELRDPGGKAPQRCDVLVHRSRSALLDGPVFVAGIAVRYVFENGVAPHGRMYLLPAYCASLG